MNFECCIDESSFFKKAFMIKLPSIHKAENILMNLTHSASTLLVHGQSVSYAPHMLLPLHYFRAVISSINISTGISKINVPLNINIITLKNYQ